MKKQQESNSVVIAVLVVLTAAVTGLFGWMLAENSQAPAQQQMSKTQSAALPTRSTDLKSEDEAVSWKTYTNSRVGYQFEYPGANLALEMDESIKYPDAQNKNKDLVQFAFDTGNSSEKQPITFGVETYVGVAENSTEEWIQNEQVAGNDTNLAHYTKRVVGGQTAYSIKGTAVTYVLFNNNIYVISARTGIKPTQDGDAVYNHILSTFKFTK